MEKLSTLRKKKNLTQRQLANILGISQSAIGMYETGARVPSLYRAKKIADFFNVRVDEIFFGEKAHDTRARNNKSEQSA